MKHEAELTRTAGIVWVKVSHHTDTRGTTSAHLSESQATDLATQLNECVLNLTGMESINLLPEQVTVGDVLEFGVVYVMPYCLGEEVTLYLDTHARLTFDRRQHITVTRKIS